MRFHFVSLGCPKNAVDTEMMVELLRQAGHKLVENPRAADVLIVNTCGFIEPARDESYEALRELAAHKRRGQRLIAAGCLAQRDGAALRRAVPAVDAVIGTRSWSQIVEVAEALGPDPKAGRGRDLIEQTGNVVASVRRRAMLGATAYLKIADGCDAGCAFCAIPLIKGPQVSKSMDDVLREAGELATQGVREAILIAQDTTAYGSDRGGRDALPTLIERLLAETPSLAWLRLMYAYPQHLTTRLVETLASSARICHYLDLPLQHGHPDMLRRMRRPHDVDQVYALIAALRSAMPDVALRSTFIVGFPGETDDEFEGLLRFMEEIAFDKVGVFAYSREEGTAAALFPDQVPPEVIAERHERSMLAQQSISLRRNLAQVGRELEVLVEGVGEGLSVGRSYREAPEIDGLVLVPGEHPVGEFLRVRIVEGQEYDLIAEAL
ncbi:MAG: 30S ribosomal protein S12 methylthiotransferase RimO [Anaerolineae bacterium]